MMRMHAFHRTELLLGQSGYASLSVASVCVVGVGGVGGFVIEALARSGVAHITMVDFDRVCLTNLNRQIHATRKTVGASKVDLMASRVREINPRCDVRALSVFYEESTRDLVLDRPYDAVIDCIDHMATKLDLIETCRRRGLPIFAAMGAGSRLDPTRLRVSDISKTRIDPFARIVRKQLRKRGITRGVVCVWSDEPPVELDAVVQEGFRCICPDRMNSPASCDKRFQVQGTAAWMPSALGMTLAAVVAAWLAGRPLAQGVPATDVFDGPVGGKDSEDTLTGKTREVTTPRSAVLSGLQIRSV